MKINTIEFYKSIIKKDGRCKGGLVHGLNCHVIGGRNKCKLRCDRCEESELVKTAKKLLKERLQLFDEIEEL